MINTVILCCILLGGIFVWFKKNQQKKEERKKCEGWYFELSLMREPATDIYYSGPISPEKMKSIRYDQVEFTRFVLDIFNHYKIPMRIDTKKCLFAIATLHLMKDALYYRASVCEDVKRHLLVEIIVNSEQPKVIRFIRIDPKLGRIGTREMINLMKEARH